MHVFGEKNVIYRKLFVGRIWSWVEFFMKGTRYSIGLDMLVFTMVTDTMHEKPLSVWKV